MRFSDGERGHGGGQLLSWGARGSSRDDALSSSFPTQSHFPCTERVFRRVLQCSHCDGGRPLPGERVSRGSGNGRRSGRTTNLCERAAGVGALVRSRSTLLQRAGLDRAYLLRAMTLDTGLARELQEERQLRPRLQVSRGLTVTPSSRTIA